MGNGNAPFRLGLLIFLLLLSLAAVDLAGAEEDGPVVRITWPNEGETLYAGPTSLLYKVPVKGRIEGITEDPASVEVRLDVFRGEEQIGPSLRTTPASDGSFTFKVTVNPHGTRREFEIAFSDCGTACHSEGQMALQPGQLRLEVTATGPNGRQSVAVRHVTVDVSGQATVPVQVLVDGEPAAGVTVSAATRVYLWRARYGSGVTGVDGQAEVSVEALGQAPTTYLFRVDPTLVDGVLYEGADSARVVLPPGARSAPSITLTATGRRGTISGQVQGDEAATIHAVRPADGSTMAMEATASGAFSFEDVPIDRYRLTAGGPVASVDLTADPVANDVTLPTGSEPAPVAILAEDETGARLPFAWATSDGESGIAHPRSGAIRLANAGAGASLMVHAPGYFSQAQVVSGDLPLRVALSRRPETRLLPWGDGRLVLPAGSRFEMDGRMITLEQGWIWGEGADAAPFTVATPAASVTIATGNFALEVLSSDRGWLYLFDGAATVRRNDDPPVVVEGGQMVNLWRGEGLRPVSYDPVAVAVLAPEGAPSWMPAVWERELRAQLRDRLARAGIGIAQVITFVTYSLALLAALASPLLAVYVWRRWRPAGERAAGWETGADVDG